MSISKALEESGTTVKTGIIRKIISQHEVKVAVGDSSDATLTVPLQGVTVDELGLMMNRSRNPMHPVVVVEPEFGVATEVYDGITGKPLYLQSVVFEERKKQARAEFNSVLGNYQ